MAPWTRRAVLVALDLGVLAAAGLVSGTGRAYGAVWAVSAALFLAVFTAFGLYHRLWLYAGVRDLLAVLAALAVAGGLLLPLTAVPAERRLLYWLLVSAGISAVRLSFRAWRELSVRPAPLPTRRVLIAGAGDAGAELAGELRRHPELGLEPVGFVDDSAGKRGLAVHGLPVAGTCQDLAGTARRLGAQELIIAMPSADGGVLRAVWDQARAAGMPVRLLPPWRERSPGEGLVHRVRAVRVEDLLGRPEVRLDTQAVRGFLAQQVVLVTGAGGSIGTELCQQVARLNPAALVVLGHGENSLYRIHHQLREQHPDLALHPVVADIQDRRRMVGVMAEYRPAVVFHAAAHKHVPLMELNPAEAVKNNILGTYGVAAAAVRCGVQRFVLISTDKAVNAVSVMGASKQAAERIVQALAAGSRTGFVTVRFGNVLGSRGSVVPLFQDQIAGGGPVTVTDAAVTRYFMTIPEAASLVIQAAAMGESGDLYVLDMGEPVRIVDLARDLIRLAGLEPERDIALHYVGLRPGEKLCEELFTAAEGVRATRHERILRAEGRGGPHLDLRAAMACYRALCWRPAITAADILAVLAECTQREGVAIDGDGH